MPSQQLKLVLQFKPLFSWKPQFLLQPSTIIAFINSAPINSSLSIHQFSYYQPISPFSLVRQGEYTLLFHLEHHQTSFLDMLFHQPRCTHRIHASYRFSMIRGRLFHLATCRFPFHASYCFPIHQCTVYHHTIRNIPSLIQGRMRFSCYSSCLCTSYRQATCIHQHPPSLSQCKHQHNTNHLAKFPYHSHVIYHASTLPRILIQEQACLCQGRVACA